MKKKITIGIPTHKRPDLLKRCLKFLIKNKTGFFVTIAVDGIDQTGNQVPIFRKGEWVN